MPKQIRKMPSTEAVAKHWQPILKDKKPIFAAFGEKTVCMACQAPSIKIERAHIKAKSIGGSDDVENLHNLCITCHKASEMKEAGEYWDWFDNRSVVDSVVTLMMQCGMTFTEVNKRLEDMRKEAFHE